MTDSLSQRLINLDSLLEFSARLNETYDELFILNSTLLSLMGKLKVLRACAMLREENGTFRVAVMKGKIKSGTYRTNSVGEPYMESFEEAKECFINNGYEEFLPVDYQKKNLAYICLGKRTSNDEIDDEEKQYSRLVCAIAANAIQSARNYNSLNNEKNKVESRHQLLATLFEIGRDFSTLQSKERILKMLYYNLMGQLTVSHFAVYLENDHGDLVPIVSRFEKKVTDEVLNDISELKHTVLINNCDFNPEIKEQLKNIGIRVFSPMFVQGKMKGFLLLGNKMGGGQFDSQNIHFLEALGNIAVSALENERLFKEEVEKKKLEGELSLALEIQKNLLPKSLPEIEGFQLDGTSIPSRHVGGDYYDFFKIDENNLFIAIADVSGKGMPASLLMANVQASLRLLSGFSLPIKEIILRINNLVYSNTSPDKFVTFFCGILDIKNKKMNYVNAGHNPPLMLKSGEIIRLTKGGLILGFTETPFDYEQGEIEFNKDDILVLFTDGVTEALDKDNEEYGDLRLTDLIIENSDKNSAEILNSIVTNVNLYSFGTDLFDDITCVVLKAE